MAQFFYSGIRSVDINMKLMKTTWNNISLKIKRIALAVTVYMLSTSMTYYSADMPHVTVNDEVNSKINKAVDLGKFTFAGEVIPFESPIIMNRYNRAMKRNKTYSRSNHEMIKASKRWYPLIDPILKKHGIPYDFKYIPAAESKFVHATSSKGAVGYWQMMPSTARGFGLEVNDEVDERYHPIKSTEVACKLLKHTYKIFGDWTSVALAYNVGSTALYRLKKQQRIDNVHFLKSNRETENYFFNVMASKELIENHKNYGYKTQDAPVKLTQVKVIEINESIKNLKEFASEHKIDLNVLKNFNPWLRANSLTIKQNGVNKSYQLVIPVALDTDITFSSKRIISDTIAKNNSVNDTTATP